MAQQHDGAPVDGTNDDDQLLDDPQDGNEPEVDEPVAGDDGDDGADDGQSGDGGDGDPDEVMTRDEVRKVIKSRSEAKKKYRDLLAKYNELKSQHETAEERIARETREEVARAEAEKYKPIIVEKDATAKLIAAKVKGGKEGVARVIRLMDLEDIDINDSGELEGVDEEVERLQEEYPELFGDNSSGNDTGNDTGDDDKNKARNRRKKTAGTKQVDGAGGKRSKNTESMEELLLRGLRGNR